MGLTNRYTLRHNAARAMKIWFCLTIFVFSLFCSPDEYRLNELIQVENELQSNSKQQAKSEGNDGVESKILQKFFCKS